MTKPTVLLVDDEADMIRSLSIRLRAAGYEVLAAMDAFQATQSAIENPPDVMILDLGIPAGGGHLVIQRLQASSKTSAVPIIVLSARSDEANKAKAMAGGATDYITKPFDAKHVLAAVADAVASVPKT